MLVLEINEDPYSQDDGQWKGNFVEGTQSLLNVSNFLDALEMDLEKVARAGGGGGAGGLGSEEEVVWRQLMREGTITGLGSGHSNWTP